MPTDKTGAEATVSAAEGKYTIAVGGEAVGLAAVADRANQRVFYHTEVDEQFGGRGLATILIDEALRATRADGKHVVPLCVCVSSSSVQMKLHFVRLVPRIFGRFSTGFLRARWRLHMRVTGDGSVA